MKRALLYLWIGITLAGCNSQMEEEISWELDDYPDILVIEGSITNETKHHVISLSLTGPYFETSQVRSVNGALVSVSDGINTFVFTESDLKRGTYVSDSEFTGKPLVSYSLDITLDNPVNGISHYSATSVMPEGIDIDTIICEIYELPDIGFPGESSDEEKDTTILSIYMVGN